MSEITTHDVPTGAALDLRGVHRRYGAVRAVDGVDLTVAPGEVVALLGPNGAGKSTLVDVVLGLSRPDAGEVEVFGRSPARAVAEGFVGAMLQEGALLDDATVGEMVGMVASLHRAPLTVRQALERAGIADLAGRRSNRLSGGQRQRVRFAVALVSDPGLLVLDEPTAAMDVRTRHGFWASMHDFAAGGRTVVFATHYLEEAEAFADRVVLLRAGRVVADGSVAEVRGLASGRTVSAVLPPGSTDAVRGLPGVAAVEAHGDRLLVTSGDSDATLRALLARFPDARDVEVTAMGLDEAFLALTGDGTAPPGDGPAPPGGARHRSEGAPR